jgi:hypothetical protein
MVWFLVQLALNAAWSPVFFGWHETKIALVTIVALLIAIGATIFSALRVDRIAAWLLAPYLACRVGGDVAIPTPHRPGRANFQHPVLHGRASLAVA